MPDLHDYAQLWLGLQLVASKRHKSQSNEALSSSLKLIAADLIKIFNGNERWQATEMNISEAALISSGLAVIRIENEKFIADLSDVVKHTLRDASNMDLALLVKGSHHMRKYKHASDLYSMVHAHCMERLNLKKLTEQEIEILSNMFTTQGVFTDSPFVQK